MTVQIAIDERLFTWPSDAPVLLGSRCAGRPGVSSGEGCGVTTFPAQSNCPRCGEELEVVELPRRGTLWTWTTQGFRPKGPPEGYYLGPESDEEFVPYFLGYVELPGHCKVESRLIGDGFEIGDEMELAIVPFRRDADGNDVMTFAFRKAVDA